MTSRRQFLQRTAGLTVATCLPSRVSGLSLQKAFKLPGSDEFLVSVESGKLEEVRRFLKGNSALVNATDQQGRSPFAIALLNGHAGIAALIRSFDYQPDLHEAALCQDWDLFDQRSEQAAGDLAAAINRQHPIGGTAMYAAAAGGAGFSTWRVYANGGDPNQFDPQAATPVQRAMRFPDLQKAEFTAASLLSNDADPDRHGPADLAPIFIAIERDSATLVELLMQTGADLNLKNELAETPSLYAKRLGRGKISKLLQQQIPPVVYSSRTEFDAAGNRYRPPAWGQLTVLQRSAVVGDSHFEFDKVQAAIKRDRRLAHSVATTGEICVEASAHMGQKKIVDFLLKQGAPYSLPTAVMMDDMTTVKQRLKQDPARIHERGAHFFALLWYTAIGNCRLELPELLIDQGADVEQQHFLGTTALHFAAASGNIPLAELFIQRGADVNRVGYKFNGAAQTPVDRARSPEMIEFLKSNGAQPAEAG